LHRWDGDYCVGMENEKPKKPGNKAKKNAVPKSESRSRRTKTEKFTASCVSGISDTWLIIAGGVSGGVCFLNV
jgi:hypothetical protein